MQDKEKQQLAFAEIDRANQQDPNQTEWEGQHYPKEYLYSLRMTERLAKYTPQASSALQIAARAHHICRWEIPRTQFPKTKAGYYQWRTKLKRFHAQKTADILQQTDFEQPFIDRVKFLILKKQLQQDPETQALEDVICLVFLEFYFEDFSKDHEEEKLIDILKKTWLKMSDKGKEMALQLPLNQSSIQLITKALADT